MPSATPFPDLLRRLRKGEAAAVREFVSTYEDYIRRTIRRRLARSKLQAAADSDDLCQSVLGSFLIRAAAGEYELASAEDLQKLLMGMAKNKLAALARRESAQRRDRNRVRLLESGDDISSDSADNPEKRATTNDLLDEVRRRLPPEERVLFESRRAGKSWEQIAADTGETAVVLRKRLSRALNRVAVDLGLEDDDE